MTRLCRIAVLPVVALALSTLLGGCVVYPEGGYGRGYGAAYYPAPVVAYEGGWRHHHRDRW